MKVLFAVNNENISEAIIKMYQRQYKEIITYKNVYYFNAIIKELQKDKTYDRVVISEDLEPFTNNNYDAIDKFIFDKLDKISDEATKGGIDIPIILICTDRREKSEPMLVKLFGIGVYNAILGNDRSVEEVCSLLKSPRVKRDAKEYYRVDTDEVSYQAENEDTVSETELQNILAHYKRLGKDEERYVESFNNIAAQYNDAQLRLIVKVLPINVKAVLEANSPKYQSVMTFRDAQYNQYKKNKEEKKTGALNIGFIKNNKNNSMSKPVVIPSEVNMENVRKVKRREESPIERNRLIEREEVVTPKIEKIPTRVKQIEEDEFEDISFSREEPEIKEEIVEPPKRGRGRPKKQVDTTEEVAQKPKRGRGRPKKQVDTTEIEGQSKIVDNSVNLFDLSDEPEEIEPPKRVEKVAPKPKKTTSLFDLSNDGYFDDDEDEEEDNNTYSTLPGFEEDDEYEEEDDKEYNTLPGVEEDEYEEEDDYEEETYEEDDYEEEPISKPKYNSQYNNNRFQENKYNNRNANPYEFEDYEEKITPPTMNKKINSYGSSLDNLLTGDKKVISFVGTSKNGTSFLVNNLGEIFSSMGIKTAILDATQNKNSFYIYTKNEENLRKVAYSSFENLRRGKAEGIDVNKNLSVYTSLPGEGTQLEDYENILTTLAQNYSVVLIDCDFETEIGYFDKSQEIYLVQSMDILTIQPLTAFLRDLKSKGILDPEKIRIIINKEQDVRTLSAKAIVGGLAYYNDPAMSFMTELFNKDTAKFYTIPFDMQVYSRYLEGLVNCEISLDRYPKDFIASLKNLAGVVYPLLNNKYSPLNNYGSKSTFSANTNNTLNKMKNRY